MLAHRQNMFMVLDASHPHYALFTPTLYPHFTYIMHMLHPHHTHITHISAFYLHYTYTTPTKYYAPTPHPRTTFPHYTHIILTLYLHCTPIIPTPHCHIPMPKCIMHTFLHYAHSIPIPHHIVPLLHPHTGFIPTSCQHHTGITLTTTPTYHGIIVLGSHVENPHGTPTFITPTLYMHETHMTPSPHPHHIHIFVQLTVI